MLYLSGTDLTSDDERKLIYAGDALHSEDAWWNKPSLDQVLFENLQWQAKRSPREIMDAREEVVAALEKAGQAMMQSGAAQRWFAGADDDVVKVASGVNGLLLEQLAFITGHVDRECVEFFRRGAPFVGKLPCSGIGEAVAEGVATISVSDLQANCVANNETLLDYLREEAESEELFKQTQQDAQLGRMSQPVLFDAAALRSTRLVPRFAVVKMKDDGSFAVRPVDHFSWSAVRATGTGKTQHRRLQKAASINGACIPVEKLSHDHLDDLAVALEEIWQQTGLVFGLFKADVDAAFRRVPVMPEHKWACAVAFVRNGETWTSTHNACPFGGVASVHAWERVGALVAHIARKMLKLVLFRYVDDFFGCENEARFLKTFCTRFVNFAELGNVGARFALFYSASARTAWAVCVSGTQVGVWARPCGVGHRNAIVGSRVLVSASSSQSPKMDTYH